MLCEGLAILAQSVEQVISNDQVVGSNPIGGINNTEIHFKIMSSKSKTGAYMSQYDNEVEKRLSALESKAHEKCDTSNDEVFQLKKAIFENGVPPGTIEDLTSKVDKLIEIVQSELGRGLED